MESWSLRQVSGLRAEVISQVRAQGIPERDAEWLVETINNLPVDCEALRLDAHYHVHRGGTVTLHASFRRM